MLRRGKIHFILDGSQCGIATNASQYIIIAVRLADLILHQSNHGSDLLFAGPGSLERLVQCFLESCDFGRGRSVVQEGSHFFGIAGFYQR